MAKNLLKVYRLKRMRNKLTWLLKGQLLVKPFGPLAARYKVELPITTIVRAVVWENASPHKAAKELFDRPLTTEFWGIVDK